MNGQNTNTSGTAVANVDTLPKGVLEKVYQTLGTVVKNLAKVIKGESTLASNDFAVRGGSDRISDSDMAEIARRLIITLELKEAGNVVFSANPPGDKSKVWWQVDGITGIPTGSPKVWNSTTQTWENVQTVASAYVPPQKRSVTVLADAGQSQHTVNFPTIQTTDYSVQITPTTFIGGNWLPAPGAFATHFGFIVTNKGEAECTISFFGTPTGGANFEVDIEERI